MTSWLGWLQMVGLVVVAVISVVIVFSVLMRPARWADRKPALPRRMVQKI